MNKKIEDLLERGMFASRWFMAPVYVALSLSLFFIMVKVIQEFFHFVPLIISMDIKELLLFVLHIVDLALIGNLVLMIIFAGYENFVSKIGIAQNSEDKPSWMGKVDFSGLKLKLIASIVAISGINLLEAFMDISSKTDQELRWMVVIHIVFIVSGVLLALMDYIASKTQQDH
jgi:uncharacterized protein (TIGR00645 family)|tara:strand:- start:17 stop:535 length:519 start_codon:yes stop_codon:yes gene_type:complete